MVQEDPTIARVALRDEPADGRVERSAAVSDPRERGVLIHAPDVDLNGKAAARVRAERALADGVVVADPECAADTSSTLPLARLRDSSQWIGWDERRDLLRRPDDLRLVDGDLQSRPDLDRRLLVRRPEAEDLDLAGRISTGDLDLLAQLGDLTLEATKAQVLHRKVPSTITSPSSVRVSSDAITPV
jgi:hypothetical protein